MLRSLSPSLVTIRRFVQVFSHSCFFGLCLLRSQPFSQWWRMLNQPCVDAVWVSTLKMLECDLRVTEGFETSFHGDLLAVSHWLRSVGSCPGWTGMLVCRPPPAMLGRVFWPCAGLETWLLLLSLTCPLAFHGSCWWRWWRALSPECCLSHGAVTMVVSVPMSHLF